MTTFRENVLRIIAVLGLLAVLLLGAWGIIQIAFVLPSFFGNIGGAVFSGNSTSKTESISASVPISVTAGQPFKLTWAHTNKNGEYSYAVSVSCESNLTIAAPVPTGAWSNVPCNTPFNYISASTSMPLVAVLAKGTTTAHPTFTVTATKLSTGAVTATGKVSTTVSAGTTTTQPKPTTTTTTTTKPRSSGSTYYPSGRTTNLYGYADLAVTIQSANSTNGNVAVVFTVANIGTNVSPANWTFNAVLPINGSYTYPAGPQQALYPGDKIVYTLRFAGDTTVQSNCTYPYPYPQAVSGGPGTCNAYGPCNIPGYPTNYYPLQPQYQYASPCTGYTGSGYAWGNVQSVSIQVDPYNLVREVSKANNYTTASYYAY